jgi:hypothetical protein
MTAQRNPLAGVCATPPPFKKELTRPGAQHCQARGVVGHDGGEQRVRRRDGAVERVLAWAADATAGRVGARRQGRLPAWGCLDRRAAARRCLPAGACLGQRGMRRRGAQASGCRCLVAAAASWLARYSRCLLGPCRVRGVHDQRQQGGCLLDNGSGRRLAAAPARAAKRGASCCGAPTDCADGAARQHAHERECCVRLELGAVVGIIGNVGADGDELQRPDEGRGVEGGGAHSKRRHPRSAGNQRRRETCTLVQPGKRTWRLDRPRLHHRR